MNNEQQTWILKPGIDLRIVDLKDGLSFVHYVDDYVQWETEHVNALFMKLDVAGLTRQVEELSKPLFVKGREGSTRYVDEVGLAAFAEQVVLLLLNQEKETK